MYNKPHTYKMYNSMTFDMKKTKIPVKLQNAGHPKEIPQTFFFLV